MPSAGWESTTRDQSYLPEPKSYSEQAIWQPVRKAGGAIRATGGAKPMPNSARIVVRAETVIQPRRGHIHPGEPLDLRSGIGSGGNPRHVLGGDRHLRDYVDKMAKKAKGAK